MEFNKAYNRSELVKFLHVNFLPEDNIMAEEPVALPKQFQYTRQVTRLGNCESLGLVVYEVRHSSVNDARVGLTKEAFRMLADEFCERALVFFVPQDDSSNYRFSLIEITLSQEEGSSKVQRTYSNPHRYSYYLGEGVATHTPDAYLQPKQNSRVKNTEDLRKRFSVEVLTNEFYNKLFNWYLWATDSQTGITFPNNTDTETDDRDRLEVKIIRLITRMLFVWFIKQKQLVPTSLFDGENMKNILLDFDPESATDGCYYNAILQNLFFATLNQEIEGRAFITPSSRGRSESFGVKNLYRDDSRKSWFLFPEKEKEARIKKLFSGIPYLNGGLFECLDKTKQINGEEYFYDGFSSKGVRQGGNLKYRAFVPNMLFFADEHRETVHITENETKDVEVMGLLELFKLYNFTVEENTSSDVDVSLDPELLGHVFENLLAAYNPETQESARKSTGSFYTPRVIVDYMVDESLKAYLNRIADDSPDVIDALFSEQFVPDPACRAIYDRIETALRDIKVLDPACGSGAFPMGMLLRITELIGKLHPEGFDRYQTKLDIIKRCIYGVDIQPIAMMICKLRFFISLICDCERDEDKPNFGIIPLPNLETKFVAANSLLPAKVKSFVGDWTRDEHLVQLQQELLDLRQGIVDLRKYSDKKKNKTKDREKCREIKDYIRQSANQPNFDKIKQLEKQIAKDEASLPLYEGEYWVDEQTQPQTSLFEVAQPTIFRHDLNQEKRDELRTRIARCHAEIKKERSKKALPGFEEAVNEVTRWDPYDQNAVSPFFDAEWMFGVNEGFDIVIGNPPYVQLQSIRQMSQAYQKQNFHTYNKSGDIYCLFVERGMNLLCTEGHLCYIMQNKWMQAEYGKPLRSFLLSKRIQKIIDFGDYQVFCNATTYVCILLLQNSNPLNAITTAQLSSLKLDEIPKREKKIDVSNLLGEKTWILSSVDKLKLLRKIEISGIPLGEYVNGEAYRGILSGLTDAFLIDNHANINITLGLSNKVLVPFLLGRDIKPFATPTPNRYLILFKKGYTNKLLNSNRGENENVAWKKIMNLYPDIATWLKPFSNKGQKRGDKGDYWWELRACDYYEEFHKSKIMYQAFQVKPCFIYDEQGLYCNNSMWILPTDNKSLLGILNSKMGWWLISSYCTKIQNGHQLIWKYFRQIPIPKTSKSQQQPIVALVDRILSTKKDNPLADTKALENKIDLLVYHLYGLTYDEVLIVDPETPITREEYEL